MSTPPSSPYLLWVTSRPTNVSPALWKEWYATEHLPECVRSGMGSRATFYEEVALPFDKPDQPDQPAQPRHALPFLALYQTAYEEAMRSPGFATHRATSGIFAREGGTEAIEENGEFEVRNYGLVQSFDLRGRGEVPPPFILTVEMTPRDADDFHRWYAEEHLELVARIPGYLRSQRFRIGPPTPRTQKDVPSYLAVHEVESLEAFASEEAKRSIDTPWAKKHVAESDVFVSRGWKLVCSEGY